jgi:hypothetical protein
VARKGREKDILLLLKSRMSPRVFGTLFALAYFDLRDGF